MNKLLIFSAPSGSGKSTIIKHLLTISDLNLAFSVSATSRLPRGEEKHGNEYYFLSEKDFKEKISKNEFLEWEEVYQGNFYGTLLSEVERLWALNKVVVFDIDVVGGLRIKEKFPAESLAIFIKPPSLAELEKRLTLRQTESPEKIKMRLAKAEKELAQAEKFDVIIENDFLEKALLQTETIVREFLLKD